MNDNMYRLILIKNLEYHNHYNDYFDTFKASKLSVFNLYVYVELTTPPTPETIENEKQELRTQWQSDHKICMTIYLWKELCTIVGFNGIVESYRFQTVWLENNLFKKDLDRFFQIYFLKYLSIIMRTVESIKMTKERLESWRGRAKAFKELRNPIRWIRSD